MKRLHNIGIAGLLMALSLITANAQGDKITKTFHQDYAINKNSRLSIDNKYGSIDVKNWNADKVTIDVVVSIEHTSQDKAKKLMDYISVTFSQDGNDIKAVTDIDEKFNTNNWFHFGGDNREFSINYTINLPSWLDVRLTNKYGDIFISELSGPTQIFLKYGNMKANKLLRGNSDPMASITLAYANATVDECNWMKLDMKYSKFNVDKGMAYVIVSKYSKLALGDCSSVVSESRYDDYRIGKVSNLVTNAAYSGFKIDKVDRKLDATTRYTGVSVDKVPASFESIKIDNSYGGIKIGIDESASYSIDGHAKYAKITVPDGHYDKIEENTSSTIKGLVGKDNKTKSVVTIETSYGGVKLVE